VQKIVIEIEIEICMEQTRLFMVALCNRADHYIFALWFLSIFFFFLFFLA